MATTLISIRSLVKRFGAVQVLRDVSLDISEGEFLTILGESGSGKTTLLRLIAGFEQPDSGEIWMEGQRLDLLPAFRRRVNTVFQNYALFPHLSVFDNVAYGLRVQGFSKSEIPARVEEALSMVKMQALARSRPGKISGGQQQRVALARALINHPRVLLLDEPLSALDANLRRQMQRELKSLQREVGISFLFVTHDQEEAMTLSDRIALLHAGKLEQVATPREIYQQPATRYAADFIGQTNLLRCLIRDGYAQSGALSWRCEENGGSETFSLRPENISIAVDSASPPGDGIVRFRAKVDDQSFHGASDLLQVTCTDGQILLVRIPSCENLKGEHEFEFSSSNAIRVLDELR